jgi:hypothetical protein
MIAALPRVNGPARNFDSGLSQSGDTEAATANEVGT